MAMSDEKVKKAFEACMSELLRHSVGLGGRLYAERDESGEAAQVGPNGEYDEKVFQHLAFVCTEGKKLIDQGRREKAMRWLGFVQGCLWVIGVPLEVLKEMNKPDEEHAA